PRATIRPGRVPPRPRRAVRRVPGRPVRERQHRRGRRPGGDRRPIPRHPHRGVPRDAGHGEARHVDGGPRGPDRGRQDRRAPPDVRPDPAPGANPAARVRLSVRDPSSPPDFGTGESRRSETSGVPAVRITATPSRTETILAEDPSDLLDSPGHALSEYHLGLLEGLPLLEEVVVPPCAIEIHVVGEAYQGRELPGGAARVRDFRIVFPDDMCPQYSASSRVLIFSRIARWRSTSRYIGVSRKSRVPLVRGRFLPFVMPDRDGVGLRKRLERTGHELF